MTSRFNVVMTAPSLAPPAVRLLEAAGCAIHYMPPFPSAEALAALAREVEADAIISRQGRVTAAVMDASPRLRIVARHGVGVDEVDVVAARGRGLLVTRGPGSNTQAVAEHTLALILALVKELRPLSESVARGGWRGPETRLRDLAGLRLGLVGFGPIGQAVARLARPFGMVVSAYTPRLHVFEGVRHVGSLEALAPESDVLSLHCPLLPETRGLVGTAALAALPEGAFLVNTARGALVDEAALLAALDSGHLAGAGLDMLAEEPPPPEHPLRRHPRVILTPHVGGTTAGALEAMAVMAAECVVAALHGAPILAERIVCG